MKKTIAVLFFLSGVAGLIYQLLWVRQFTYLLGSTYLTVSIVIASFMTGLLAGARLAGSAAMMMRQPVKWYALLEIFIGLYALLFVAGITLLDTLFGGIFSSLSNSEVLRTIAVSLVILIILLPPTCAMGVTLPLLVHHFTRQISDFKDNISLFYAVNTLGGAAGVLLAGFYLIEHTGIHQGMLLTGIFNLLIGITAWMFYLKSPVAKDRENISEEKIQKLQHEKKSVNTSSKASPSFATSLRSLILITAMLSGFTALAYEIVWTRALKFLIQSSTYSFTVILFTFLLGIAVGSQVAKNILKKSSGHLSRYGWLQIALSCTALFTIYFLYRLAYTDFFQQHIFDIIFNYSYGWFSGIMIYALICGITFLIPAILMGMMFPVLNEIYYETTHDAAGKSVSRIYVVNTAGSIAGALASGFILIPAFGIKWTIVLMSIINLLIGIFFLLKANQNLLRTIGMGGVAFMIFFLFSFQGNVLNSKEELKSDGILFYKEGLNATVKVYQQHHDLNMSIDGMEIASTSISFLQKERLIAHLPFFINPQIQQVLSVGLASGISTASIAEHTSVKKIDCVELMKPVFEASTFFSAYNHDIQNNPKVRLIHNDIYAFLKFNAGKYDLISSDGKLGTLDNANTTMLSSDYYQQCKKHLNPGGLFIQWIPLITPQPCFQLILQTLRHSFNYVSLFYFYPSDVFMIGSDQAIHLDLPEMNNVMQDTNVFAELSSIGFKKASDLMCGYAGNFENQSQQVELNTMDHPLLEFWFYRYWKASKTEGGYRADNLELLIANFQRDKQEALQCYLNLPNADFTQAIYNSSLNFFQFCELNFKKGSYEEGLKEYTHFKKSIPF